MEKPDCLRIIQRIIKLKDTKTFFAITKGENDLGKSVFRKFEECGIKVSTLLAL